MRTIFVVEGEENTRYIIGEYLIREKFKVETFASVKEVLERLQSGFPDMFIMDIALPDKDSLDFYCNIKCRSGLPVIVMTDQVDEINRALGLAMEDNEYLSKPCSPRELVSQVRSLFRRFTLPITPEEVVEIGNLKINPNERHTTVSTRELMLTPMEYEFLLLLAQQPHRTFNRQELLDRVWGCDYVGRDRAVDDLVKRLRKKLREGGSTKNVKTIWGCGYRFEE